MILIVARRMRMALRPINRIKHVVDSNFLLNGGTQLDTPVIASDETPTLADTDSVQVGSKVNGIYLKVVVSPNETISAAIPNVYMIVTKSPGGSIGIPTANAVGSNDNKRFVIHQEMIMIQNQLTGLPATLFNGVIAIPRGYRRFGPNDRLDVSILCPILNITACIQCHYKEFR